MPGWINSQVHLIFEGSLEIIHIFTKINLVLSICKIEYPSWLKFDNEGYSILVLEYIKCSYN